MPQSQHGPASRLTAAVEQQLRSTLRQQPDLSLAELQQRLAGGGGHQPIALAGRLQRVGLRHKKIAPGAGAGERRNLWRRQAWWEQVSELDPACLVLLDESRVTTEMAASASRKHSPPATGAR